MNRNKNRNRKRSKKYWSLKSIKKDKDLLVIIEIINDGVNINDNNGIDEGKVVVRKKDESIDEYKGILEVANKKNNEEPNSNTIVYEYN